jgi:crotonobetainyl-CoA:carnitine CoA-transferase CaiB-like acyl-CoA transferase
MYLVAGILAALREAELTGRGQVVDAAIVDGVAHPLSGTHALINTDTWADERGVNLLDGGAPFYSVYETADGRHMAVGAIEAWLAAFDWYRRRNVSVHRQVNAPESGDELVVLIRSASPQLLLGMASTYSH